MFAKFNLSINLTKKIFIALIFAAIAAVPVYFFVSEQLNKTVEVSNIHNIKQEEKIQKVSLAFIGDLLMHTAERKSGYIESKNSYNFDGFFKDVKQYFKGKDFVIGSLETPIIKEPSDCYYSGYPNFKNPPQFIEAIKNAGINVLVTSNNHVVDCGSKGAIETMEWLEKNNILYTGTYKTLEQRQNKPVLFLKKGNIKLALMNYTEFTNSFSDKPYILNYIDYEKIKKDIEFAKKSKADIVMIWLHFGTEYHRQPSDKQKEIVEKVIELGADIIIGSHPHVIQPIEVIRKGDKKVLVAYSLGNFISNQYWRYSTDGMILNVEIEKKENKTEIKNINYIPTAVVRIYKGIETQNEKVIKTSDKDSDFITYAISRGILSGGEIKFRIMPVEKAISDYEKGLNKELTRQDYIRLKTTWEDTTKLIGETKDFKIGYTGSPVNP